MMLQYFVCLGLLSVFSSFGLSGLQAADKQFKVIGYLPSWSGQNESIAYSRLTHINYSFILPKDNGSLKDVPRPEKLRDLVKRAHASNVKVGIAIGGWNNGDDSAFETLAASSESRQRFIRETMKVVKTYNLDGVDMDWEYPDVGKSSKYFLSLMRELSSALRPKKNYLSMAVVSNGSTGNGIDEAVFPLIDMLNIMAYDGKEHGKFEQAEASLNYWRERGCPNDKLILGLPFYGRSPYVSYRNLLAQDATAQTKDVIGKVRYNGIATIKKKTELAHAQAAGVMIWELSQDTTGDKSLLKAIDAMITAE
ncbi:MAG: glycosyl hydrolase family 18 protein [Verrucomicrobiales bacterium]|nr:glycosyl hydrolase family 18 protein [Verrucomicrobiales bacterium]